MLDIILPALFLSFVLLGIHAYFGIEIIKRGIIFTDLAIGQMAALGAAVSLLFMDGAHAYPLSLAFALTGAVMIAYSSRLSINLEAFIGLIYAFGYSGCFIVLSKSAHGMEEFKNLMAADILFTPTGDIIHTAILYLFLGVAIYFVNHKTSGIIRETLFFVIFAFTVTSSVRIAGVLIVFSILIAPAFISLMLKAGRPLIMAWVIGVALNSIATYLSFKMDYPTGYAIVFVNSLAAIAIGISKGVVGRNAPANVT